jgi:hypothetical protein
VIELRVDWDGGHVPHHAARGCPGRLGSGARERIAFL